jgi:hypothetical protein
MLCGSGAVSLVRNDSENAVRRRDVSDGARLGPPPSARASIQVGCDLAVPTRVDAEGFADSRLKDVDRQGLEAVGIPAPRPANAPAASSSNSSTLTMDTTMRRPRSDGS